MTGLNRLIDTSSQERVAGTSAGDLLRFRCSGDRPLVLVGARGVPLAITHATVLPAELDSLAAANRHAVYGHVARWLVHDLRNPAQALTLVTEMMGEDAEAGDPGAVETVREATIQLSRSLELLDRLLRIPRPASELVPLSLLASLEFIAALHRSHHAGASFELDGVNVAALPAVTGVEHEVEQILLNLLLNSLEALGERADGRVVVRAVTVGDNVQVSVADNGPGIAPEGRARLFHATPSVRDGQLRGLGLAVSKALARRAGGDLTYAASDAAGARFDLLLPAWRRG